MGKTIDRTELLELAQEALQYAISRLPVSPVVDRVAPITGESAPQPELRASLTVRRQEKTLICRVLSKFLPSQVLPTALPLKHWIARSTTPHAYPVIIAPYISPRSARLLIDADVGYVDLAGNFRLAFEDIYLEREVPGNPAREQREVTNLFSPQATRVLLALLNRKGPWQGNRLAEESGVSMGYVSGIKKALQNQDWVRTERKVIELTQPEAALDTWRSNVPKPETRGFYTTLHGLHLKESLAPVLANKKALLAGTSAADYLAPYARANTTQLLTTKDALGVLTETLRLKPAASGANVLVELADASDIRFAYAQEVAPGIFTTDAVSTYLSLWNQGERMQEAADHLRISRLSPMWESWIESSVEVQG